MNLYELTVHELKEKLEKKEKKEKNHTTTDVGRRK